MHRIAPPVIFSLITGLPLIFDIKEIAFRFGRRHSTIRYSSPLNPIAYSLSSCFHSTLENFDDRTRAHVKRTLLLKRVENRHARTCASVPVRRNRVSILCGFSLSVKSSRCHTSSFSLFLSISLPSPLSFLYLFLALCHARIFTRVVFLPHMLAFRDTGGTAQRPRYMPPVKSSTKNDQLLTRHFSFSCFISF